jgi:beta-lactamase regulating signal transducer with metallopeptidase domain
MSLLTLRALLFAAECAAASLLLPLLAFAATRLIRRAALRHLVWLTMFGVLAVLPPAALLLPAQRIALPAPAVAAPAAFVPAAPAMMMPEVPAAAPATIAAPAARPLFTTGNGLLLLLLLWLVGLLWHLGRMALGGVGLLRLRRQSDVFALADAPCELRLSLRVSGPSTFGVLRPVILLPQAARDWNRTRLEAVLAHETAHVRRRDAVNQLLVRLVCAVYWLNPLLWLAARALRREAELAADDAALASGLTPSAYAAELVALAAETRGAAPGIAMAGSALAARVQAVLSENVSRKGVTRMDMLKTAGAGLALTLLLGAARFDLAMAQPPARPPAPSPATAPSPAPQVNLDVDRNVERKLDVEVDAVKARADAVAAQARARAEAEPDAAKRAQYREEAARVAAGAAEAKARADATRQRAAQVAQQAPEAQQQGLDTKERALEAEARALAARTQADAAVLDAARQQKLTVSPFEVDERVSQARNRQGAADAERRAAILEVVRERLAADTATPRSASRVQMTTEGNKNVTLFTDRVRTSEPRPATSAPSGAPPTPFGARTLRTTGSTGADVARAGTPAAQTLNAEEQRLVALTEETSRAEERLAEAETRAALARQQADAARRNLSEALRQHLQSPRD